MGSSEHPAEDHQHRYDTIILGAGIAGLAAARTLAEAGQRILLLEARDRVGGRLHTIHAKDEDTPIELGAEFIHGRPPELLALLKEAGLAQYETAGTQYRYTFGNLRPMNQEDSAPFAPLEDLRTTDTAGSETPDQTFDEFLADRWPSQAAARRARQFVEGFNAADAARIGTRGLARQQAAEDAIEGDRSARLVNGYTALAEYLRDRVQAAGASLLLNTPAKAVVWSGSGVSVTTSPDPAGIEHRHLARRIIATLPLGILQAGAVRFDPLPHRALAAAKLLACGTVQRLVLRFRSRFWTAAAPHLSFLFTDNEMPPTWWTTEPRETALLTGWVGGPGSLTVATPEQLLAQALASLERIFACQPGSLRGSLPASLQDELLSWHTHDWQRDPWSLGAYSYALKGGAQAAETLASPVEDTLFFAGEHTDITGHPGTVHGALRSGLRAASQVLALASSPTA